MNAIKKIFFAVSALCLCCFFTACGANTAAEDAVTENQYFSVNADAAEVKSVASPSTKSRNKLDDDEVEAKFSKKSFTADGQYIEKVEGAKLSSEGIYIYDLGTIYWLSDEQYDFLDKNLTGEFVDRQNSFSVCFDEGTVVSDSTGAKIKTMAPDNFTVFHIPVYDLRNVEPEALLNSKKQFKPYLDKFAYSQSGECDFGSFEIYTCPTANPQ